MARSAHILILAGLGATGCFGKDDTADPGDCDTPVSFYADADADGYGLDSDTTEACSAPVGYAEQGGDCDDADPAVNPAAEELCNEVDDDCDGEVDVGATDGTAYYPDVDTDGFGADDGAVVGCEPLAGWLTTGGDCDDGDAAVNPDAVEACNGVDDDCDGLVDAEDDDVPEQTWYADADGDGYGDSADDVTAACAGDAFSLEGGDCDDGDASVNPGAAEVWYDGVDQDCDNGSDFDQDGDHYTSAEHGGPDCDDLDPEINPAQEDIWYDGVDSDCDERSDFDQDGDGYDHEDYGGDDCDDEDNTVHPGLVDDDGDGVDDDCSGVADDDISLGDADASWQGESTGDQAGQVLAGFGDLNGDGYGDLAVGVPAHGSSAGAAYVQLGWGGIAGSSALLSAADIVIDGDSSTQLGTSLAFAGDVDGDGFDDLLVGATSAGSLVTGSGEAYLYLGGSDMSALELSTTDADTILAGSAAGSQTGFRVAGVGDMTGDGLDDLVVSAPGHTVRRGITYLVSEPATGIVSVDNAEHSWIGETADDYAGQALAAAGDVDGDGTDDLLIGSYINDRGGSEAGSAYLVLGPGTHVSDLEDADGIAYGVTSADRAAYALDGVGDTDGDGYDDLLIGAYQADNTYTNAGEAYLVLGPFSGELDLAYADATFEGPNQNAFLGAAVARAGDVDEDGNTDFLLGAYGENSHGNNTGAAYLVLGPVSGALDLETGAIKVTGESSGNYAGVGVAGAGDVDGDGSSDLLVGARGYGSNAGKVYLLLGPMP